MGIEYNRGAYVKSTELGYSEQTLYSGQLNGLHKFY